VVEQIDIGGPSLLRASAKNFERVAVVIDPGDYATLLAAMDEGDGAVSLGLRHRLATKAFAHTAAYDASISNWFEKQCCSAQEVYPERVSLHLRRVEALRYGENPHQAAAYFQVAGTSFEPPELPYEQLQGKSLSYNNLVDVDAAWALVSDLPSTAVAIIKHTNPAGACWISGGDVAEVFRRAKETDPVSAFGGIVATNEAISPALADELNALFLEVVVAPLFSDEALRILARKKNLRLLRIRSSLAAEQRCLRSALGGVLLQDSDRALEDLGRATVVSKRQPTPAELADLTFAWVVCKHVKSNAIVFAKAGQLVAVGAGQMSRVDSVKLAAFKAVLPLERTVVASDAFFPFRDGVDASAEAGAVAVVQPGGSIRDDEVIAAANERDLVMLFTGTRHFRH
jgi:phosphoribosylaminoimidazolecarboxamide formyltransferase/IMP cyclohydrolase